MTGGTQRAATRQLSLRARLVVLTIVISMALVTVVAAVSLNQLGARLLQRVDSQVTHAVRALPNGPPIVTGEPEPSTATFSFNPGRPRPPGGPGGPIRGPANLPARSWVGVISPTGEIKRESVAQTRFDRDDTKTVPPNYRPANLVAIARQHPSSPVTVARYGGGHLRLATALASDGDVLVVAVPLDEQERTLASLLRIELLSLAIGLVIASLAAWLLITRSLRPLRAIASAADRIAHEGSEHDPSKPLEVAVPGADGPREVAQVSAALSAMLSRITDLFRRQHETEAQLRRLVGDASHELRTPITAMRGHAELIAREHARMDADQLTRSATRIAATAQHLGHLVDQLLDLARLDEHFGSDVTDIDLTQIATAAVDDARAADASHPNIVLATGESRVHLRGDATAVRQLFDNLLANSRAHTPPGTTVTVSVTALENHDGEAQIIVADDGPGIAPDEIARAVDRFWRGSSTRAGTASSGAGLGLAIVDSIAHAHGGDVTISAQEHGTGLVVTVRLASL